ncbi:MAG: hypothetical protein KKB31_02135, partial [Nanoarchaeota archaeon]|nr:hypothetical protein [Nanoarchaeota archaeon]
MEEEFKKTTEEGDSQILGERHEESGKKVVAHKETVLESTPFVGDELEKRKKKVMSYLKKHKDWAYYIILAFITYLAVFIRTRNLPRLRDITTGTWTLGPDLDPFLFLRWAKEIAVNGGLMALDTLRYSPIGYDTAREMKLLSYLIAWFHNIISFFNSEATITYSAVIFPVFMFALTAIAFFLFARKIFYKEDKKIKNIIALLATAFFVLIPSLLHRTIAGIPEKESAAFFFMFMAFYFFFEAFTNENIKRASIFGILSGAFTALMALVWGGYIFIFFTIPAAILISFIFGKMDKKLFTVYSLWLFVSFLLMMPFSKRYDLDNILSSTSTGLAIGILVIIGISMFLMKKNTLMEKRKGRVSKEIFSLFIATGIIIVLALLVFGPEFFSHKVSDVKTSLISPQVSRFGLTVAENKQPYFINDWKGSFGPLFLDIPLFFWMFVVGAMVLFNNLIKNFRKKPKILLTISYVIFLICLIFSRYSSGGLLDGSSGLSLLMYFGGWILFIFMWAYVYQKEYRGDGTQMFKGLNFAYILYFLILTLGIIGARGAIRLIMLLGAISPVAISFLVVRTVQKYLKEKEEAMKFFIGILAIILILASVFTLWTYYKQDKASAEGFAPGPYQWQWQKAMSWVRDNTPKDAVFAHWWDYGYWLQSLGERTTILDGSNSIVYWNHLMGRHVLTGPDERTALEFLYTHEGTHFLIDSTDIGKYTAFSSIGADENYDRFSWISTFLMDSRQTQETSNETVYVFVGGTATDDDIVWKDESGKEIFLPKKKAGVGAIFLRLSGEEVLQPQAVYVYNNVQYNIPLRYAYVRGEYYDFGSGLDAGIFVFPSLTPQSNGGISSNDIGASLYLSSRTIHSNLANLYLFEKESNYF